MKPVVAEREAFEPAQTGPLLLAVTVGLALTVTVVLAELVQPFASVIVTVYEEPLVGKTAVAVAVVPLLIVPGPDHE